MSLFFGNKVGETDAKPSQRPTTRQRAQRLERVKRKSRKRGSNVERNARRLAEVREAQRRILTGEVDVPEAVRRNVEHAYERQMRQAIKDGIYDETAGFRK